MNTKILIQNDIQILDEKKIYKKVILRLIPFLMLCYFGAYLDRVNVGFAKLQMLNDLQFSEMVYGLGAGMFFIGYFIFEVPSNLLLHRFGAKAWLARIMITWAIISASFAFVTTPTMFYVLRFLLGVAEAGFAPGVIFYLTCWFPSQQRAKALSIFFMAIPFAGIFGGPLSGWIMDYFHNVNNWAGWKWLFILEALPSLISIIFYLDNKIDDAKWLNDKEKIILKNNLHIENQTKTIHTSLINFLKDKKIWLMSAIYFCIVLGQYGITFWLPTLVKNSGVATPLAIGFLTAIPYIFAIIALPIIGISADKTKNRKSHLIYPMLLSAIGFFSLPFVDGITLSLLSLSLATAGILVASSLFWSIPATLLSGVSAAAGIAIINSIANLAGFFSPTIVGWLNVITSSSASGLFFITAIILIGIFLIILIPKQLINK